MSIDVDVLVVGAGVAGLSAARTIRAAGHDVVVLEARDRIGGRVLTHPAPGIRPMELGAQVLHGADHPAWDVVDMDGEATAIDGAQIDSAVWTGGAGHPLDARGEFVAPLAAHQRLRNLARRLGPMAGGLSVSAALRMAGVTDAGADAARQWVEQVSGVAIGQLPLARLLADPALAPPTGMKYLLDAGLRVIPERLGAELPIELDSPVDVIESRAGGVRALTRSGRVWRSRAMVFTAPPTLVAAGSVVIAGLPPSQYDAARELLAAPAVVAGIPVEAPATTDGFVFAPALGFFTWHRGEEHVLLVSKGTRSGAAADWAGRPEQVAETLAGIGGHRSDQSRPIVLQDWAADPWSRGALTLAPDPASTAARRWRTPFGRLHFAGESTQADAGHPYLDRAIRSGQRAGAEVLARVQTKDVA